MKRRGWCVHFLSGTKDNFIYFSLKISFDVDHFLKVFIEFVTILLLFYVLFCFFLAERHVGS